MPQQTFNNGDTAPIVRQKLNNNASDVTAHHQTSASPHGTSLTQANLTVTGALSVPDGNFVRSLSRAGDGGMTDAVTLSPGTGVSLTQGTQDITIEVIPSQVVRVCQYGQVVLPDIHGDGYLSIPCDDVNTGESFQPQTGAAGFIIGGLTPDTGSSYEGQDHVYAYAVEHGDEGEPYDSYPMLWYQGAEEQADGWRMIIQYRNADGYLAFWCRAERIG